MPSCDLLTGITVVSCCMCRYFFIVFSFVLLSVDCKRYLLFCSFKITNMPIDIKFNTFNTLLVWLINSNLIAGIHDCKS